MGFFTNSLVLPICARRGQTCCGSYSDQKKNTKGGYFITKQSARGRNVEEEDLREDGSDAERQTWYILSEIPREPMISLQPSLIDPDQLGYVLTDSSCIIPQ